MSRNLYGLIVIGLIVGVLAGFGLGVTTRPTKTVTKLSPRFVQITNGMPLSKVVKILGRPAATVQQPTAANKYVACLGWDSTGSYRQVGDWKLILCGKVQ